MIDKSTIQCIALDADDTLWHNETFYTQAENDFFSLLSPPLDKKSLANFFCNVERNNMDPLGYGAKAMTLSMIQTALTLNPNCTASTILKIIEIGKSLLSVPTIMLDGVTQTVSSLQKLYKIIIITKGELNEQQRKFDNSPLDHNINYFVVHDKNTQTYAQLFKRENIDIHSLLMVGNSPKSDIMPILELGGFAAYIPFEITWALEHFDLPDHPNLITLSKFSDLLNILL